MKKLFSGIIICAALFLSSCATVKQIGNLNPVYVTNTKSINLLSPVCMDGAIDNLQLLKGTFGSESFSLLAYFQSDDTGIFLALLNDFGTDMGNLTFDGTYVEFETAVFPQNLKAEYIIADIQHALYKAEDVKNNLSASKLTFTEEVADGVKIRKILSGKKLIEEIKIAEKSIIIKNYLRGYEYNLIESE